MVFIKGKSLRLQLLILILVVLLVPALLMLYDLFYASKSDEVVLEEKEKRLTGIVKNLSSQMEDIQPPVTNQKLLDVYTRGARPVIADQKGIRLGLYLVEEDKMYLEGFLHEYRELTKQEQVQRKKRVSEEVSAGIKAALSARETITRVGRTWDDQFLECLAPVMIDGNTVAVVWAEERMHPIFAKSYHFRQVTQYATLIIFCISILGLTYFILNITRYISKIQGGLEVLEDDINFRLESMPGEMGQIAGAINKMADGLAEKEQLREQLQKADFLATLGRLATGIAHELRNPLGVLRATVEVMEDELRDCPEIKTYVRRIQNQIDRQNKTVNELLEFGRPGDDDSFYMLNVNELVNSVINFCQPLLKQYKVECKFLATNTSPVIWGNPDKLKQVFLNLVVNAVEAMPGGGVLNITTEISEERVKVIFKDNGQGISREKLSYIFEPFYTTKERGSGLGLAISQQITGVHGGNIMASSAPGEGTGMTVYLPLLRGEE